MSIGTPVGLLCLGKSLCLVRTPYSLDEGAGTKVARRRFLRLIWVPSSQDKSVCSPKQITWVNTQKDKLRVKAFSLAYDFLKWLVPPGSGALSG